MKKILFSLLLVIGVVISATTVKAATLIYDFPEGVATTYTKMYGQLPTLDSKEWTALVIAGHSALAIKTWSEEKQAEFFLERGHVVAADLRQRGFLGKIELAPKALEIGSKVLVLFTQISLTPEQIRAMIAQYLEENKEKFRGPQGVQGLPGPAGPQGLTGPQGILVPILPTSTSTPLPSIPNWLDGVIVEVNLPHYARIGKEFGHYRIDIVKGFDESGKWWGGGFSYLPTERWEVSLIGVSDKFRGEKVVIGDFQANYAFFKDSGLSVSLGLDYGKIFPFKALHQSKKEVEIEGERFYPILMFSFYGFEPEKENGKGWKILFHYSPEFGSLRSGEFKEEIEKMSELGLSLVYEFGGGKK